MSTPYLGSPYSGDTEGQPAAARPRRGTGELDVVPITRERPPRDPPKPPYWTGARVKEWVMTLLLISGVIWVIIKPAIDSQYAPTAKVIALDDKIKEHEKTQVEALGAINKSIIEIQSDIKWLVRDRPKQPVQR